MQCNSSALGCNDDGNVIVHRGEVTDYESSDEDILDEFSQIQELSPFPWGAGRRKSERGQFFSPESPSSCSVLLHRYL